MADESRGYLRPVSSIPKVTHTVKGREILGAYRPEIAARSPTG